jgi:hypothetical protein
MSACQLGKGRNCREGVAHKQGNWRIFEQPETYSHGVKPPSRARPLPQESCVARGSSEPVGAGMPAKGPLQAEDQRLAWR